MIYKTEVMKVRLAIFHLLFIFAVSNITVAQKDFEPTGSLRVDVGLPATLEVATNAGFRDLLTGLLNTAVYYQNTIFGSITLGVGGKYTLFNVNEFKNNIDLEGNIHLLTGFGKIGYERYYGMLGVEYSIRAGYSYNFSSTNFCKEELGRAKMTNSWMIEPGFTLSYVIDERNAWTLCHLSYSFYDFRFNEEFVCVENLPGFNQERLSGRTSFLTFGFGYTHYLK